METNNYFLIGSGFTKGAFENAPLNSELLNALLEENTGPTTALGRAWNRYAVDDIEVLLTRLDLDTDNHESERSEINNHIATFFMKYCFEEKILDNKPWLARFAQEAVSQNDVIVNLNYDCLLEGLLDYYKVWTPNGGYLKIQNPLEDSIKENPKDIFILKIHGSVSFREKPYIDKPALSPVDLVLNPRFFPESCRNSSLGTFENASHYIIAPSFVKIPKIEIMYLMIEALKFVNEAKNFIIIGCGLREEDSFVWLLLTNFLKERNDWQNRRIIIIDPNAKELENKIKNHWAVNIRSNLATLECKIEEAIPELIKLLEVN